MPALPVHSLSRPRQCVDVTCCLQVGGRAGRVVRLTLWKPPMRPLRSIAVHRMPGVPDVLQSGALQSFPTTTTPVSSKPLATECPQPGAPWLRMAVRREGLRGPA